jgi:hypothetical protein
LVKKGPVPPSIKGIRAQEYIKILLFDPNHLSVMHGRNKCDAIFISYFALDMKRLYIERIFFEQQNLRRDNKLD